MKNPFLIGEKIYLKASDETDAQVVALSENHPAPRAALYHALPTSVEQQKDKIKKLLSDPNSVALTICTIEPDEPIGITFLTRIDWVGRMATFYIAIAEEKNWSQGYGSEATRLMRDYTFATLNLNRLQLHVSVENEKAVRAYEKAGFKREGRLRQAMYFKGCYHDFFLMAVLREDWQKMRSYKKADQLDFGSGRE